MASLTLDEEKAQAYEAVGIAISQWARVEAALCNVFVACAGTSYTAPDGAFTAMGIAPAIFYSVENFRTKAQMVDAVIRAQAEGLDEPSRQTIVTCWSKLKTRSEKAARARNYFAHSAIILFPDKRPGRRALLMPSTRSPKHMEYLMGQKQGFAAADVRRITGVFARLTHDIRPLFAFLGAHPELRSRAVQQVAHLMLCMSLSDPSGLERAKRELSWPE